MTGDVICIYPPPGSIKFGEGIDRNGKLWKWEFTDRFGPLFLRKDGEPMVNQPIHENHPAWEPFREWFDKLNNIEYL
jgi:hypothetical protein